MIQPLIMSTTTHAAHREKAKIHHVYAGTTHIELVNSQVQQDSAITEVLHHTLP